MATIKEVFTRPIEITAANNSFSVDSTAMTITAGVYANIATLVASINNLLLNNGRGATSSITDSCLIQWEWQEGRIINSMDAGLADLLGFTDTSFPTSAIGTHTADSIPENIWIPTFHSADQGLFEVRQRNEFTGRMAQDGSLAGNTAGPTIYYRKLTFVHELSTNAIESACTSADGVERCLEKFGRECRISYPATDTYPSTKGFYFYPDINDIIGTYSGDTHAITTSGGIHFDYSSSPDTYVFCHLDDAGYRPITGAPSLPKGKLRYNVSMEIHTATAPGSSWTFISAA